MAVRSYTELIAWQKAMDLVEAIYPLTNDLPREETFSLRAQLRRAAVSIQSHIAEGQGRGRGPDFVRLLDMARGSLFEVETQVFIADRLGLIQTEPRDDALNRIAEVGRLIAGLRRSILPD